MKKVLPLLFICAYLYQIISPLFAPEPHYQPTKVVVVSGDTMWDIASRHALAGEDVREVIFRIVQANKLQDKYIYPGQVLLVPVVDSAVQFAAR